MSRYENAADLLRAIDDRRAEGVIASNLGQAYLNVASLLDLDRAEHWYRRALDLTDEPDRLGRARRTGQLGEIAQRRLLDASRAGQPESVLLEHLNAAAAAYRQALDLLPADANPDLATVHHQLGNVHSDAGDDDAALTHFQQAIRLREGTEDRYGAGLTRYNVALLFTRAGRTGDALLYAHAALADFASYGVGASADIERVQRLIARLEPPADPTPTGAP